MTRAGLFVSILGWLCAFVLAEILVYNYLQPTIQLTECTIKVDSQ